MSAETKAHLEAAIAAHVADETDGCMVSAYVVVAETTDLAELDDARMSHWCVMGSTQSGYTTDGLLHNALYRR